jgi:hypothetical protein
MLGSLNPPRVTGFFTKDILCCGVWQTKESKAWNELIRAETSDVPCKCLFVALRSDYSVDNMGDIEASYGFNMKIEKHKPKKYFVDHAFKLSRIPFKSINQQGKNASMGCGSNFNRSFQQISTIARLLNLFLFPTRFSLKYLSLFKDEKRH